MDNIRYVDNSYAIEEYESAFGRKRGVTPSYIKKIANDVVTKLRIPKNHVFKLKLLQVENYKAELPEDFYRLNQMAYRREKEEETVTSKRLVEWAYNNYDGIGCDVNVSVDCKDGDCDKPSVVIDADRITELTHPEYLYQHSPFLHRWGKLGEDGTQRSSYNEQFKLLKPAQNNFFNPDYYVPGCLNLSDKLERQDLVEYKIDFPQLIVNTEECEVLLSYLGETVGDDGYRKIPNIPDIFEAINWKIEQMVLYKEYLKTHKRQLEFSSDKAYQKYREAFARAYDVLDSFTFDEFYTFMRNHWTQNHPYYEFRENANRTPRDRYSVPRF